jgi:hypothetical protein
VGFWFIGRYYKLGFVVFFFCFVEIRYLMGVFVLNTTTFLGRMSRNCFLYRLLCWLL